LSETYLDVVSSTISVQLGKYNIRQK